MKLTPISFAVAATLAAIALPATAQQQLERVEVTGSRILSPNAESPAPIQVMTAKDIAASGVANLQELLVKNPAFGTPGISRTNSNFSTSSAGVATINLRNLGANRTLVLVNGRRYVSGVPGDSSVDLNTIPTDFIERVEVMTGGASSTYGSDAVAGVVNIILKRNFEGLALDVQGGQSWKSDDKKKKFSASFGVNAPDNKGNLMLHLGYTDEGAVYSRDRDFAAVDQYSMAEAVTGESADLFKIQRPFYSSFAPQGRFFYDNTSKTFDAAGNLIDWSTNGPAGDGVGATGFNRSAYRTIAVPTKRLLLASKGEYNLSDAHSVFFEGTYANTKTVTRMEPFALDSSKDIYKGVNGGYTPAEFMVGGQKLRNPLIHDGLFNLMTDRDGDGLKDYNFTRRLTDIDVRGSNASRDTFRLVTGLKGELNKTWSYDTFIGYGYTKEGQTGTGQVNTINFANALQVIKDPVTGQVRCLNELAIKQGCAPANVFGANTLSAEASKYLSAPTSLNTRVTQALAGANVTGEPFSLPAGPVGVAMGAEWRKETSSTEFDALTQTGLNAGNALANTSGSFDVKEIYAEVRLPLLANLKGIKALDGTAALRHGDYSTVGSTNSWNLGLDWAINSAFRVRATQAQSTRAPNIGELYQGPSQTFPTGLVDPCNNLKSTDTSPTAVKCMTDAGVRANMAANGGVFTLNQSDKQGISGYDLGNPALMAEKGKSTTLGVVITPKDFMPALKNVSFTIDYFDVSIADAINQPGRQFTIDQCYKGGDQAFCKLITRRQTVEGGNSAGSLAYINQQGENSGGQKVRGVDLTASYADKVGIGRLAARLSYTYLIEAWTQARPEADTDSSVNEIGSPRNKWVLNLGYNWNNFGIAATTTFIGASYLDDQFLNSGGYDRKLAKVSSRTYLDLQGTYTLGKTQFYLGINNVTNTKAPPILSGLPGNVTGAETDSGTYDAIGRRVYVGLRYSM